MTSTRITKYATATMQFMQCAGHATNADILAALQSDYPGISATTVHRITQRLAEGQKLQLAPSLSNVMRYDANLEPHDHFMCTGCGMLRDAKLGEMLRPAIEKSIGGDCSISGSLTISGLCKQCHTSEKHMNNTTVTKESIL